MYLNLTNTYQKMNYSTELSLLSVLALVFWLVICMLVLFLQLTLLFLSTSYSLCLLLTLSDYFFYLDKRNNEILLYSSLSIVLLKTNNRKALDFILSPSFLCFSHIVTRFGALGFLNSTVRKHHCYLYDEKNRPLHRNKQQSMLAWKNIFL